MKLNTTFVVETEMVPKQVTKEVLAKGRFSTHNNAEFHYSPDGRSYACVKLTQASGGASQTVYVDYQACREAAEFFTTLAALLEVK